MNGARSLSLAANPGLILLLQIQRATVDAVAQARRVRAVLEHMPEMAAAVATAHLGTNHPVRAVGVHLDVLGEGRLEEARPARARFELGVGAEQSCAATGAVVHAIFLDIPILAGERALGALAAQHFVLLRRELLAPLGVRLLNLR